MLKTLIWTYFKGNGGLPIYQSLMGSTKKGKGSKILFIILFIFLMLVYVMMISGSLLSSVIISPQFFFIQALSIALLFGVMFSYTSVETILIKAKDLVFLSPLPIKKKTLNLSRILILYFEVAFESLLVFIPFFIVSAFMLEFNLIWYILGFICMLTLPLLATAFMAVVAYLGAKFKLIRRLSIIIIYAISFLTMLYLARSGMSEKAIINIVDNISGKSECASFIPYISVLTGLILLLSVGFIFLAIALSPLKEFYSENEKRGKKEKLGTNSITKALIEREWSIIRSNSSFTSELIMEQIIPVVLLVIYSVMGIAGNFLSVLEIEAIQPYKGFIVVGVLSLFYSMSMVSSTSVSREGKDFYLLKVLPITAEVRVKAKILFHLMFTLIFALPLILVSNLFFKIDIIFTFCAMLLLSSLSFTISTVGLLRDFSTPHLDWKLPTVAIKQNINGLIAMLIMLPILVASGFIVFLLIKVGLSESITAIMLSIFLFLIGYLFKFFAIKSAKKII